jgi:phage gpG-like protein
VAKELARRAIRVETAAKQFATGQGGGPHVRTGRLRSSISWRLGLDGQGLYAQIGSNVEYAAYVELGTDPHEIRPRARQALFWEGAAHPVRVVFHPGTRPHPYLRPALAFAR